MQNTQLRLADKENYERFLWYLLHHNKLFAAANDPILPPRRLLLREYHNSHAFSRLMGFCNTSWQMTHILVGDNGDISPKCILATGVISPSHTYPPKSIA
jgi:hypothetical protein